MTRNVTTPPETPIPKAVAANDTDVVVIRKDLQMAWLIRLLSVIAAAITSLFVARDALNFGIIQTLLMITLVVGAAAVVIVWQARREL